MAVAATMTAFLVVGCGDGPKSVGNPDSSGASNPVSPTEFVTRAMTVGTKPIAAGTVSKTLSNSSSGDEYVPGTKITVTAVGGPSYKFKNWTATGADVKFANANSETTTFTMPTEAVTITANFGLEAFTDHRDGKAYKKVMIGRQTWMAENLNYKTENSECPENDNSYCAEYGRKYTWDEAMVACPAGWHLPDIYEWEELVDYVGGNLFKDDCRDSTYGSYQLKAEPPYWEGEGTDTHGFSALPDPSPALLYYSDIPVYQTSRWTRSYYVSPEPFSKDTYLARSIYMRSIMKRADVDINTGYSKMSVRCVQDSEIALPNHNEKGDHENHHH
jgi:uncharacterized protein (TIGR02145 family)